MSHSSNAEFLSYCEILEALYKIWEQGQMNDTIKLKEDDCGSAGTDEH